MESQLVTNVINAIIAIAAVAAVWAAVLGVRENRKQAQQTQYSSARPLLVPGLSITFQGMFIAQKDHPTWLEWSTPQQGWKISNIGTGPAFNVACVYYGAESYVVNGKRSDHTKDVHWTCWLGLPIIPNETAEASLALGNGLFYVDHNHIRQHSFNAPPEPMPTPVQKEPMHVARLTMTYHDIFKRKHASIFDYVQNVGWQLIAFEEDIKEDLHDLQG